MENLLMLQALEILRFAAQGRAWPGGESSTFFREQIGQGEAPATKSSSKKSERVSIDAGIIRQALLGGDVDTSVGHINLNTEAHHVDAERDSLERGLYRNSTIVIKDVTIKGHLNMLAANVPLPVYFINCTFPDGLSFQDATCRLLGFTECEIAGANLQGITVEKTLFIHKSHCRSGVDIGQSQIGGTLLCAGSRFEAGDNGPALSCNGAKIMGSVFLREEQGKQFHTQGLVDFIGATIGGNFECSGGRFRAGKDGSAMICVGAKIGGNVFLGVQNSFSFHSTGVVTFQGATIGGQMSCVGGRFEAKGDKGQKHNIALTLRQVTVSGFFSWRNIHSFMGRLDLSNATVGTLYDEEISWPTKNRKPSKDGLPFEGELVLDGFRYDRLDGRSPTDAITRKKWLACQPKSHRYSDFQPFAWTQLASVLRADGHEVDARQIAVDREKKRTRMYRQKLMRGGMGYLPHWLGGTIFGGLVRYGYSPLRGVIISLSLITVFGVYFAYEEGQRRFIPAQNESLIYMAENKFLNPPAGYPAFNPWIYSIDLFVPLINLQQSANWQPLSMRPLSDPRPNLDAIAEDPNSAKQYFSIPTLSRLLMWLEIALGWVMTAMTGLAFTGVLRRE